MWNNYKNISIQKKLLAVNLFAICFVGFIALYTNIRLERMINNIDTIYESNVEINNMSDTLKGIHHYMTEYLETKSTESMQGYYEQKEQYESMLAKLNDEISNNPIKLKEKNICSMSYHYLFETDLAISYKRGRKTVSYASQYEEASKTYLYISTMFQELNYELFEDNTQNYTKLIKDLKKVENNTILVLIIVFILNIFIMSLTTRKLTMPLKKLVEQAHKIGLGNFEVPQLEVNGLDEVGIVSTAFNEMIISIRDYIHKLKLSMENEQKHKEKELKMENYLKDAKLKYLQAQIHPHFLFNTLNAGTQIAMMEDADRTYEYLQKTAQFFRYNIKKDNDFVPLKDELELVDLYIYILNVRFAGDIHYQKIIDDERLTKTVLPSMTLQPIIENSVKYGIREMEGTGFISLHVFTINNNVYIKICDNGSGIIKEKIQEIYNGCINQTKEESNGVGLSNVISRLKLFYNRENVFTIESEGKGKGTTVLLNLGVPE